MCGPVVTLLRLQAVGVEPGMAGNFVQFGIFVFFVVGWIASYILRVVNKASPAIMRVCLPARGFVCTRARARAR